MDEATASVPMSKSSRPSIILPLRNTSNVAGSSPLTHFHRFIDLPQELREMIFEACLPRRVFNFSYEKSDDIHPKTTLDLSSKPKALPSIAWVCKEAYGVSKRFLREYKMDLTRVSYIYDQYLFTTTRILFGRHFDTLYINYCGCVFDEEEDEDEDEDEAEHDQYLESLPDGPFTLALMPGVNIILNMNILVGPRMNINPPFEKWLNGKPYRDCLTKHDHCNVILATTEMSMTGLDVRASGLFGLLGDERHALIDVADTSKIDQYEDYIQRRELSGSRIRLRDSTFYPMQERYPIQEHYRRPLDIPVPGRYGTQGRTRAWERMHPADAAGPPLEFSVAARDVIESLQLIKQSWLEANDCFEPGDSPIVPWSGDLDYREWDDEHPVAKFWLRQLPEFLFVVMYAVTELDG
ncbi:hypothetical protein J7T55_001285 [Diaporthe amygdali]|uniref:uncharacterized protein n=1 Tax=Phomopsis amygdali TaxID=1214568 RepID=UPI0022FE5891|nr:uncharacterized protein J7T55_001285 [Diaporthe amygdali]KAJ0106761.1 hypothetical protein J7T55_001285 [Diaporthe amygdali]